MLTFVKIESAMASNSDINVATPEATLAAQPTDTPTPTPPPIGMPVTIIIPKMQTNAPVVPVGTDFEGKMTMPEDWEKTAWFSGAGSFKPGEKGNAVIAGHLDTIYGTLGQFYNLNLLTPGDDVFVQDSLGVTRHFVVTDKQTYDFDKAPLTDIFGMSDEKHLNLITCTGWYNAALHNYTQRLVVYTKLAE